MNRFSNLGQVFRKLAGVFFILALLGVLLGLYFLKYVPDNRYDFHRSAYQELSQIGGALQERNDAFRNAIQSFLSQDPIEKSPLLQFFQYSGGKTTAGVTGMDSSLEVRETRFDQDTVTGVWQMSYVLYTRAGRPAGELSKNLDTLMSKLVTTYKDIFDGYLLIRDQADDAAGGRSSDNSNGSKVIFNSSGLSVDYRVNTDSLLKKSDGFSLQGVRDAVIEGNLYKLFLYPLQIGKQRIILAGLISQKKYTAGFNSIPFNFMAFAGVLILLLIIHLPVLKIYLLGAYERIQDRDIRLIIGTFFIAAFVGFFLFSKAFLDQSANVENQLALRDLSSKIRVNLEQEIDSVCTQLQLLDAKFKEEVIPHADLMQLLRSQNDRLPTYKTDSMRLDSILKPGVYPYLDNLFWIDNNGRWVARWAFKKKYSKVPLIKVNDRKYFVDFKLKQNLVLENHEFTIQPTLSRLDGEYTITIVTRSDSSTANAFRERMGTEIAAPWLVGLGAPMHFVCHPVLPSDFNFSIINDKGEVLYDSKPGRALLSNIGEEMSDPSDILQCARYRTTRFFDKITFRGRLMTLFASPMPGFPYTLLVYYRIPESEGFEEHLIGLSAFLIGCILLALISLSLINEWSKKTPRLLRVPLHHFEWIYPAEGKISYYCHLIRWMAGLFVMYALIWLMVELFFGKSEFSLFFITLEFPFYTALHYYALREINYALQNKQDGANRWPRLFKSNMWKLLGIILLLIVCLALSKDPSPGHVFVVLMAQVGLLGTVCLSVINFGRKQDQAGENSPDNGTKNTQAAGDDRMLRTYVTAVLVGVFMISVIPASGIFWMIFKQETDLEAYSNQLYLTRQVNMRRSELNDRIPEYKKPYLAGLPNLKFKYGIYTAGTHQIETTGPFSGDPFFSLSPAYTALHRRFFPRDSIMLAWTSPPSAAGDSSWYFFNGKLTHTDHAQLVYRKHNDGVNPDTLRMESDRSNSLNAPKLMAEKIASLGWTYFLLYFGSLAVFIALAYRLTASLARRIFLMDLCSMAKCIPTGDSESDACMKAYANQEDLKGLINGDAPFNISRIRDFEKNLPAECNQEKMVQLLAMMTAVYSKIWEGLSSREKFILYDFALDGFANYKTGPLLYVLLEKKILHFEDHRLVFMTLGFREFVLKNREDTGIHVFMQRADKEDSWKNFKTPLMLILGAIGLFVFITQDAAYQKITGLLASISSLLPLFSNIFGKGADGPKSGNGGG